uniref:Uncharacterized protein n=1 Tax=Rhizophora mucronata TaxID=61149 RepID=A0A2P2NGT1_RHIMU
MNNWLMTLQTFNFFQFWKLHLAIARKLASLAHSHLSSSKKNANNLRSTAYNTETCLLSTELAKTMV